MTYADVASAVNKWVVTNSMKNQLLNSLLQFADLKHTTDGNKELRQSRTEKDRYDLEYIKSIPPSTLTPFSCTTDKHVLFNVKTRRTTPKSSESFLLNFIKIHEEKRNAFVDKEKILKNWRNL